MRAGGSSAENYIPKARPFDEKIPFWQMLRDKMKEPRENVSEWLELDLYEQSKLAVEKLVTQGDTTALESLHHTSISGKLSYP